MSIEQERLQDTEVEKWGPYLSERQWGTVREDYSKDEEPWLYTTHEMARSKAWRWGEEGIGVYQMISQLHLFCPCFLEQERQYYQRAVFWFVGI